MVEPFLYPVIDSISGKVGNRVYYLYGKQQCVRRYVIPRNPDTARQRMSKCNFAAAVSSWKNLSLEMKKEYDRDALPLRISGYNLYMSQFLKGISRTKMFQYHPKNRNTHRRLNKSLSVSSPASHQYRCRIRIVIRMQYNRPQSALLTLLQMIDTANQWFPHTKI